MFSQVQLLQTLDYHGKVFSELSSTNRIVLLASKASILEVCGWVEQAMDFVVQECANRSGLSEKRLKSVDEKYVKTTYGLHYDKHFEKMLIAVVGFKILEKIEATVPAEVIGLKNLLGDLTVLRNYYAHTHFDEAKPYPDGRLSIPNPSVMRAHAIQANLGLTAIENQLIAKGY